MVRVTTLAVAGATGTVGGLTAQLLVDVGLAPRLLVRDPSRAPDLGLDVAVCTYADSGAATAALEGSTCCLWSPATKATTA